MEREGGACLLSVGRVAGASLPNRPVKLTVAFGARSLSALRWASSKNLKMRMFYLFIISMLINGVTCLGDEASRISERVKEYEARHRNVVRLGSGVTPPKLVHRVEPSLPQTLPADTRVSGVTIVIFVVTEKGDVSDPVILRSQYTGADAPLLEAIKKWKYQPAMRNGQAISVFVTINHNLILR